MGGRWPLAGLLTGGSGRLSGLRPRPGSIGGNGAPGPGDPLQLGLRAVDPVAKDCGLQGGVEIHHVDVDRLQGLLFPAEPLLGLGEELIDPLVAQSSGEEDACQQGNIPFNAGTTVLMMAALNDVI